ncbi:MAG TPA: DUF2935 domain-containing protein [Bacteroidales bacterium]|nr:DUF2935 domain-containing protein [Bacteroidales bacterium]
MSDRDYVRQSLELDLFFLRIMKEHSFFIEVAFPAKDSNMIQQAEMFKNQYTMLLGEAVQLANGILPTDFLTDGEIVTRYTLDAERVTEFYTGVSLNTNITSAEMSLGGNANPNLITLVERVARLNQQAIFTTQGLIGFKTMILNNVLTCRIFTNNYPLLIDHILREARLFVSLLERLQCRAEVDLAAEMVMQEAFWNRIMAEHAKFIRGLLDPTEVQLFNTADNFGKQFDILTAEAEALVYRAAGLPIVTEESKQATISIRDFKSQGTEGLITCKIRSIILPLLGDHVLREANHYLHLLTVFESGMR